MIDMTADVRKKLSSKQKEAIGLLSIGTFLEYFGLMLYVHMGVLLNELFFPKTDAHGSFILSAFAFCSIFIFTPIGAFIFGRIGDHIGRKNTVIITTFMMAGSCLVMTALPTYEQIGITASWTVTVCRIIQGISAIGGKVGAELYLTETIDPPLQYPSVSTIVVFTIIGTVAALSVAIISTTCIFNWRFAFLFGASVAFIGSAARTRLRETPDFADANRRFIKRVEELDDNIVVDKRLFTLGKVNKKTALAYFLLRCSRPICFYLIYIHLPGILKNSCSFTAEQILRENLFVALASFIGILTLVYLSKKIYPLNILKAKLIIFFTIMFFYPLADFNNASHILLIQTIMALSILDPIPAVPIFYKHFPVLKRFTYSNLLESLSRTIMYPITSFGLVFLTEKFNGYGLLIITIPVGIGFMWALNHFQKLENRNHRIVITGSYSINKAANAA